VPEPFLALSECNLLDKDTFNKISNALKRQTGTIIFNLNNCFEFKNPRLNFNIFEVVAHGHIYVFRKEESEFVFYYSSLGSGTKVCKIKVSRITDENVIYIVFRWGDGECKLNIEGKEALVEAVGINSSKQFRELKGKIFEFENIDMESLRFYSKDGNIEPTAIDGWNEVVKGLNILNASYRDYQHELITVNLSISSLVTGFENYLKKRFIELEKEGVKPNEEQLSKSVFSKWERDEKLDEKTRESAEKTGLSFIEKIANDKVNFQIYDDCKKVYNKAYGLKFSELEIDSSEIAKLKKIIKYRHRIVHVSPMLPVLNGTESLSEDPIFPKQKLIKDGIINFDILINRIHQKSLNMMKIK